MARPTYSILLPIPNVCFGGALISDLAYSSSALIPWLDFSNWLILAGLIVGGCAAILLLIDFIRSRRLRDSAAGRAHLLFFYAALLVELFNMFVHDRDGWTAECYRRSTRSYRGLPALDYPFHDKTVTVTTCGRICYERRKVNLSTVFAGQRVGIRQVDDQIWLVSFMHYDLGFFDDQTCRLEPAPNPFGAKVLPMSPE